MKSKKRLGSWIDSTEPALENWGLIAWLNETKIELPLKGVEARLDVHGRLATIEIDQIFHQNSASVLDVSYTFPLPDGVALYQCEMIVNDRVISARSEDTELARKEYQERVKEGHRASLVERVRDNLFELALGNLAPGDTVIIRLAYCQMLEPSDGNLEVRIPFCPGIRYIPGKPLLRKNLGSGSADDTDQVPDASRISPPRMDALHPDAAYVSISATLNGSFAQIASPTHTMVIREAADCTSIALGDSAAVPDRDFVLRFCDAATDALQTKGHAYQGAAHTYALLTFQAPSHAEPTSDTAIWAQDVYFLVDRSGSMTGANWQATSRAFREFLTNLAPQDRAWVTFFQSDYQDLAEKPLPPAALLAEPLVQTLESWRPEGGTELLPALRHVLERSDALSAGRRIAIVLITDGQVGNESEIKEALRSRPKLRVHTFGIDTCVNDAFLKSLAKQQRGTCRLATPSDDVAGMIAALGARMRRPVLTEIGIFSPGWEWPDEAPEDIYEKDSLTLVARGPAGAKSLEFYGKLPNGKLSEQCIRFTETKAPAISKLWAQQRLSLLQAQGAKDAAIALAKEANLLCAWTSFVAWDHEEKLTVPQKQSIIQPVMRPAGSDDHLMTRRMSARPSVSEEAMDYIAFSAPCFSPPSPSFKKSMASSRPTTTLRETPPDRSQPLIAKKAPAKWRSAMESTWKKLAAPAGRICLDWLEQWSLSNPSLRADREATLSELATAISHFGTGDDSAKAIEFRQWAERHLQNEPAFYKAVQDFLAAC